MPLPDHTPAPWELDQEIRNNQFAKAVEALGENNLVQEVSALRKEIADLKQTLAPIPTFIATGQQVLEEFRRLTDIKVSGQLPLTIYKNGKRVSL